MKRKAERFYNNVNSSKKLKSLEEVGNCNCNYA